MHDVEQYNVYFGTSDKKSKTANHLKHLFKIQVIPDGADYQPLVTIL